MALTAYVGLIDAAAAARGRRRLGLGRRRRRGQPGGADRQAARPHGHRQRRVAGEGPPPARRARPRRRLRLPRRPGRRPPARGRAGRHRRLLRRRRRRPPAGRAGRAAPVGPDRHVRRDLRVREHGAAAGPDATSSRSSPTTSRCAASAPAPTCTACRRPSASSRGYLDEGRLVYRETIVDGLEHAPRRSCACSPVTPPARRSFGFLKSVHERSSDGRSMVRVGGGGAQTREEAAPGLGVHGDLGGVRARADAQGQRRGVRRAGLRAARRRSERCARSLDHRDGPAGVDARADLPHGRAGRRPGGRGRGRPCGRRARGGDGAELVRFQAGRGGRRREPVRRSSSSTGRARASRSSGACSALARRAPSG